jgi:hypothetical protein
VKIDPADVVSCPVDYNNSKLRVCAYEVIEELPFDSAQKDDTLAARGSVVITSKSKNFTGSLEKIFEEFSREEEEMVADFFFICDYDDLLEELLGDHTYSEIRSGLREIF